MNMIPTVQRLLARAARTDYHTFVEFVGVDDDGRALIQRPLDRLVWDFVKTCHAQGAPAGVMLPMGFGKTTQFCYRAAWEIGRDPNLLVSVVTDSEDNSKERVELIRRILDQPEYRLVFPEVKVMQGTTSGGASRSSATACRKIPRAVLRACSRAPGRGRTSS